MKKIIPAVVVTAAVAVAAITYVKKKLDKQNKVNFIEVEVKPKNPYKKTMEKVSSTAENIVSVSKEILIETVDTVGDIVETFIENPTDLGGIVEEVKEGIEEIQEILSDAKNKDDAEEMVVEEGAEEIIVENEEESEGIGEKALLINDIVADIISEEEKFITESISQETEKLIDEVVVDEEPVLEETTDEIVVEEDADEAVSVEKIMEEVALQAQQEHIEEVLSATMEEITPLTPIDLQQDDSETILKVVDEQVGEINLINDIIESLEEDDSVEKAIEDLEDIVETAIHEEPIEIDDSLLTEDQFLDKCIVLYPGVKDNKIKLIIKQVGVMLDTVETSEALNLQHFATFASIEDKDRYANIAAIEGHHVAHSDKDNELIILNTLDSDKISLCKSILQLAQDLTEYNGSYKGWTVV